MCHSQMIGNTDKGVSQEASHNRLWPYRCMPLSFCLPFSASALYTLACAHLLFSFLNQSEGLLLCAHLQGWDTLYRAQQVDPFALVKEEIESVSERLRRSIFTGIPTLRSAAEYFFKVRYFVLQSQMQ